MSLDPDRSPERRLDAASPADVCDLAQTYHLSQPLFLLGHGVENPHAGIHGDEEYLYVVAIPEYPLEQVEPPTWKVAVSEPRGFLRWDAQTDAAFSEATWQFEGSLTDASRQFIEMG